MKSTCFPTKAMSLRFCVLTATMLCTACNTPRSAAMRDIRNDRIEHWTTRFSVGHETRSRRIRAVFDNLDELRALRPGQIEWALGWIRESPDRNVDERVEDQPVRPGRIESVFAGNPESISKALRMMGH